MKDIEEKEENKKLLKNREKIASLKEKAKRHAKKFNSEFKKAMNTAIMAAFGF